MKHWKKIEMDKAAARYHETSDADHLLDITRIASYSKLEAIMYENWYWIRDEVIKKVRTAIRTWKNTFHD